MAIESISNTQTTNTNTTVDRSTLDKDAFLKLYMEQLKYQDPLDPMDNSEFTSQMAELSTVEQLTSISKSAQSMLEYQNYIAYSIDSLNLAATNHNSLVNYSGLIGKQGYWIDENGVEQSGRIESIISKNQDIYANVGGQEILASKLQKLEVGI